MIQEQLAELETKTGYKTISFDAEKELAELKQAVAWANKKENKHQQELSWYENAVNDLKALGEEIDFIRAEKTYNNWIAEAKNSNKVNSAVSEEVRTPHQIETTELVPVSVGTINSFSAEYAQYTPYIAGEPEILDRRVEVGDEVVHLEYPLYGQHIVEPVHLVDGKVVYDDTLPRWPIFEAPNSPEVNESVSIDQLAQEVNENSITGSKRGKRGLFNNLKRTGASIALALAILGCSNPFQEDDMYEKVTFPGHSAPHDELMRLGLLSEGNNYAGLDGKVMAYLAENYYNIGDVQNDQQGNPLKDKNGDEIYRFNPDNPIQANQLLASFNADINGQKRVELGMQAYRDINPNETQHPNDKNSIRRYDSQGKIIEHKFLRNYIDWSRLFASAGPTTEAPGAPQGTPTPEPVASPTAEPTSITTLGPDFDASRPDARICINGIKSVADAIAKAKELQCLNQTLVNRGMNLEALTGQAGTFRELFTRNPDLQSKFPVNTTLNMYVQIPKTAQNPTGIGTIQFMFVEGKVLDLKSPVKKVGIDNPGFVLTDGKISALLMQMCGNLIFEVPQPKVADTTTPTPSPTGVASPTASETPTPTATVTATGTPRPTPPILYPVLYPGPEATAISTPVPTSITTIFAPPPQFIPPPVEARFPVCVDIFGNNQFLREFEVRQVAANLGINPNLPINLLQAEIFRVRCTVVPPTATPVPTTATPFATQTPVETLTPVATTAATATPFFTQTPVLTETPVPEATATNIPRITPSPIVERSATPTTTTSTATAVKATATPFFTQTPVKTETPVSKATATNVAGGVPTPIVQRTVTTSSSGATATPFTSR